MKERMNRKEVQFSTSEELEAKDIEYWAKATVKEKLETITYLRECFYGKEATTGRLFRLFRFVELK